MKKTFLIMASLIISGCASKYIPPENTELVKVTYKTTSSPNAGWFFKAPTGIYKYESMDCEGVSYFEELEGTEEEPGSFMVEVTPGTPLINGYRTQTQLGSKMVFTYLGSKFTPEIGREYEVEVFPLIGVTVKDISGAEHTVVPSNVKSFEICKF